MDGNAQDWVSVAYANLTRDIVLAVERYFYLVPGIRLANGEVIGSQLRE